VDESSVVKTESEATAESQQASKTANRQIAHLLCAMQNMRCEWQKEQEVWQKDRQAWSREKQVV
jgi:hypothetical protein